MRQIFVVSAALLVTACAHALEPTTGPPDFSPIATTKTPKAALYAGCIGQAAAQGRPWPGP